MKKLQIPTKQERRLNVLEKEKELLKVENTLLKEQLATQEQAITELSMFVSTLGVL